MEWLILLVLLGRAYTYIFGESESDKLLREWREQNPDYVDVLRAD